MNWIEAVFGLAPDGGDGALEWALALAAIAACLVFRRWARKRHANATTR
jgi:hypothetical protein